MLIKKEVDEFLIIGCEMIVLDVINRVRLNNEDLKEFIKYIKENGVLVMVDILNYDEVIKV